MEQKPSQKQIVLSYENGVFILRRNSEEIVEKTLEELVRVMVDRSWILCGREDLETELNGEFVEEFYKKYLKYEKEIDLEGYH